MTVDTRPHPRRRGRARMLAVAAAALALAAGYAVTTSLAANAATTLLSQNRPATASSTENAGTPASAAVDGNTGTRWSSAFADPQWLQIDLGGTATVTQVVVQWEAAYATAFQIQTSANASTWTTIYATTTGTGGTQTLNVSGTGRYLRLYGTARATQYGYSIWELQVYGSLATACGAGNAALNRPATASSTENAGTPASAAVDGNTGTRWSSAASDPQWLQVDLGSAQSICQVVLQWETAYATAFQVQTSTDGSTWSSIYATTTGTGGTQTLTVSGTGRYLRVYGTARATQWGYSIWELQVLVAGGATTGPSPSPSPTPSPTGGGGDRELSYARPATASSYQDDGNCPACTPAKAVDNDPATRWATSDVTGWVDPGWIYIDLGATATVHSVILQWDPAYATAFQIQVSPDANTWTTIYSTGAGTGFKQTISGLSGTGRYVRMYGTARSNGYGYSLWDFEVWGTGGNPTTPPALPPDVTFPATRLVFDEEFNDPAGTTPSASRWFADTGNGQNGELEYYTNNLNASTDGAGNLDIQARKETTGPYAGQYTSGRINTSHSFTFTYGHVEARIKVSGTQGLWPAFWLLGANFPTAGWPSCGEIDVMEHVGKVPDAVYSTIHAPAYNGGGGIGSPYTISGDFASAFHTYAMDWNRSHMTFYVDGNAFFTLNKSDVEANHGPWVYDHPFFIILNNAVGGDWPGAPDATTVLPQNMLIDYVRVYQ
jgi:F5/8 type C domain/Glycosyl hydrolases family 16